MAHLQANICPATAAATCRVNIAAQVGDHIVSSRSQVDRSRQAARRLSRQNANKSQAMHNGKRDKSRNRNQLASSTSVHLAAGLVFLGLLLGGQAISAVSQNNNNNSNSSASLLMSRRQDQWVPVVANSGRIQDKTGASPGAAAAVSRQPKVPPTRSRLATRHGRPDDGDAVKWSVIQGSPSSWTSAAGPPVAPDAAAAADAAPGPVAMPNQRRAVNYLKLADMQRRQQHQLLPAGPPPFRPSGLALSLASSGGLKKLKKTKTFEMIQKSDIHVKYFDLLNQLRLLAEHLTRKQLDKVGKKMVSVQLIVGGVISKLGGSIKPKWPLVMLNPKFLKQLLSTPTFLVMLFHAVEAAYLSTPKATSKLLRPLVKLVEQPTQEKEDEVWWRRKRLYDTLNGPGSSEQEPALRARNFRYKGKPARINLAQATKLLRKLSKRPQPNPSDPYRHPFAVSPQIYFQPPPPPPPPPHQHHQIDNNHPEYLHQAHYQPLKYETFSELDKDLSQHQFHQQTLDESELDFLSVAQRLKQEQALVQQQPEYAASQQLVGQPDHEMVGYQQQQQEQKPPANPIQFTYSDHVLPSNTPAQSLNAANDIQFDGTMLLDDQPYAMRNIVQQQQATEPEPSVKLSPTGASQAASLMSKAEFEALPSGQRKQIIADARKILEESRLTDELILHHTRLSESMSSRRKSSTGNDADTIWSTNGIDDENQIIS